MNHYSVADQSVTRADLLRRRNKLEKLTHCNKCGRKVELWKSDARKGFYVDVQPAGDTERIAFHRDTCPATRNDLATEIEDLRRRFDASVVVVLSADRTSFACAPNCSPSRTREALFVAANHLEQHLLNQESAL